MKKYACPHIPTAGLCMTLIAGFCPTVSAEKLKFSLAADADHLELGTGFATAGDLDGDGIADVAVADRSGRVNSFVASGIVHIVSGADGSPIRSYVGVPAPSQNFGSSLATLKADGDEIPDLAVGSPGQTGGGVRIYAGSDGSLIASSAGPAGSQTGTSLANAGDQNGDGIDDLYVGAPNANSSRGGVFVISGSDGSILREITTTASLSGFGSTVVTIGDIDGDGKNDLAVGSPGFRITGGNPAGRVQLIRSSDGAIAAEITGSAIFNRLGESMAAASDANGDNQPDLLVGSYSGGTARLVSGTDLSTLRDLSIPALPAFQPITVGGSLDFNEDGTADWLIGSPALQSNNGNSVGGIRIVSGTDQATLFEFTASAPHSGLGNFIRVLPGLGFAAGEPNVLDPVSQGVGLAHVWGIQKEVEPVLDTDGDGVPDDQDEIPDSVMGSTVVILGVDSQVGNRVNSNGVTLADRFAAIGQLADFRVPALYYVKALHLSTKLVRAGLVDKREGRRLAAAALEGILRAKREARNKPVKPKPDRLAEKFRAVP
jgi:hypothetical protein